MLSIEWAQRAELRELTWAAAQDGVTPLHIAAHKGHSTVAKVLLAAGANKDAQDTVRERSGGEFR